jgi:MYXO-CTERM domain-containing protein
MEKRHSYGSEQQRAAKASLLGALLGLMLVLFARRRRS